jgi:hypothetical protein
MCSINNPDMVRYIFLTQDQYDSINHEENDANIDKEERKDGESTDE